MRSYLNTRYITAAFSGIVLTGFALSGAAYAISSAAFRYATPQTGYLMISAPAFMPVDQTTVYGNIGESLTASGSGCFVAPVNLPQGAKITQLSMWYIKHDASSASLTLARLSPSDSSGEQIAKLSPVPTGGATKLAGAAITDASVQTVNNARYVYFIHQCVSDQEFFISARIKYTYKTAGD